LRGGREGRKLKGKEEIEKQTYRLIRRRLTDLLPDELVQPFVLVAAAAVRGDSGDDEGHGGVLLMFEELMCGMQIYF
jgi:hypothetical protein